MDLTPTGNEYSSAKGTYVARAFDGPTGLRIKASGSAVPALDFPWEFPLVLILDSPTTTAAGLVGKAELPTGGDAELKFSRGAGDVQLWVTSATSRNEAGLSVQLECHFPSASGVARIPAAALALLAAGAELYPITVRRTKVRQGVFETTVALVADMFTPDKKHFVTLVRK